VVSSRFGPTSTWFSKTTTGLAALLILIGCGPDDGSDRGYSRTFHYSYPLGAGGRFSLETFNAAIEIFGWDEDNVDISGTKYWPSPQFRGLQVSVADSPSSVEVRVIKPPLDIQPLRGTTYSDSEVTPLKHYGARFTVKLPREAVLDYVTNSNAGIQVSGSSGPSRLRTSNGPIRVQTFHGNLGRALTG
jgi:hypothetical protein